MKFSKFAVFLILFSIFTRVCYGQPLPGYYSQNNLLSASPGVFREGLLGFVNPANLRFLKNPESRFYWNTDGADWTSFKDWGIFSGSRGIGFGILRQEIGGIKITDYRLSSGFGTDALALGFGYGWSSGNLNAIGREKLLTSGAIVRPSPFLSVGFIGNFSLESNSRQGVAEIGLRPLGTPQLTLFADGAIQNGINLSDAPWSTGAVVQVVPGLNITGRYFKNEAFTVGLTFDFGKAGIGAQLHLDQDQKRTQNSYLVRIGGRRASFLSGKVDRNKNYLPMNMKGVVNYQRYALFDKKTLRFFDVLKNIRAAAEDPRVKVIALNLSGLLIRPEHAWEIRQELRAAQKSGRQVIVFADRLGMTGYHLASVADKIILDPEGDLMLPGLTFGSTYFKRTLEKLGLGFDEWRFFKYKSAAEALSRDKMSEADREQRQAFVDDWYEMIRSEVCASRKLTSEEFDRIVDNQTFLMSAQAVKAGLIDTLGRWSEKDKIIAKFSGKKLRTLTPGNLLSNSLPPKKWGERPQIAIVYGLGECAMDSGIKARWLEKVFLQLTNKSSVKAVVFRVDSPGGDGMASDLVAEAIKKCKKNKPVIISQGQVAGSGGYWISMYGDKIVAGPNTITGSIGVIGGWIYDKGFSQKLGMSSDLVKRGEHADLGFGVTLPYIGARVPARNLTPAEREKMEVFIKKYYEIFVKKVAKGRNLPEEQVQKIARGRFYSGIEGKDIKLVDEIGGLFTAIAIAKKMAGMKPEEEIRFTEIPKNRGLLKLPSLGVSLIQEMNSKTVIQFIRKVGENPGRPLPIMLPGSYPEYQK